MAKAFLEKNHIAYEEKNVAIDADACDRMIQKSGQLGVPVIHIGDTVLVGFQEKVVADLLAS